jgi:hypothetical protein
MRQIAATALLVGNAVFLFLACSDLVLVVEGWATGFGGRSEATFGTFAGPVSIALPLLAMLLATHISPPLPAARSILLVALGEYVVSAVFGAITYLGAFANGLFGVRATFDGLLSRAVWLAFLTIAATAVYRVYRALYRPVPARDHARPVYGRPYPGQPSYPPSPYRPGPADSWQGPTAAHPTPTPQQPAVPPSAPPAVPPAVPPQHPAVAPLEQPAPPADATRRLPLDPGAPLG